MLPLKATVQAVPGSSTQITIKRQGPIGFPEFPKDVNNRLQYYGQRIMEMPPQLRHLVDVDVVCCLTGHAVKHLQDQKNEQLRIANDMNLATPHEASVNPSAAPLPSGNQ